MIMKIISFLIVCCFYVTLHGSTPDEKAGNYFYICSTQRDPACTSTSVVIQPTRDSKATAACTLTGAADRSGTVYYECPFCSPIKRFGAHRLPNHLLQDHAEQRKTADVLLLLRGLKLPTTVKEIDDFNKKHDGIVTQDS